MITREVQCGHCGGKRLAQGSFIYLFCAFCSSLMGIDDAAYDISNIDKAELLREALHPNETEKRFRELGEERTEAIRVGDRARWALVEEERMTLWSILHPESVDPLHRTGRALKAWIHMTVKCAELLAFDAEIQAANAKFLALTTKLPSPEGRANATALARQLRAAAEDYLTRLERKTPPEITSAFGPRDIQSGATDMVRAMVRAYAQLLGPAIVEKIEVEVLGAHRVAEHAPSCGNCGATLSAEDVTRGACPFCKAPVRVRGT